MKLFGGKRTNQECGALKRYYPAKAPTDGELDPDVRDLIAELRHIEDALSLRIADEAARNEFKLGVQAFSNQLRQVPIAPRPMSDPSSARPSVCESSGPTDTLDTQAEEATVVKIGRGRR